MISLTELVRLPLIKSTCVKPIVALSLALAFPVSMAVAESLFSNVASRLASACDPGKGEIALNRAEKSSVISEVAPTDPEVEFEYLWPSATGEKNRWSAGISQELPDFRKMAAARRVGREIDSLCVYQQQAARAEALYEAEKKLITLVGARRDMIMLKEIHENLDSLTAVYTRAWEKGEVTILDLNKIRIEHARASAANDEAEGSVAALTSEIIALSGGAVSAAELSDLVDYPAFTLSAADHGCRPEDGGMEMLVRNSPQFKVLEARLKVADEKFNLASKERFPRITLGYVHAYEDGNHFNGLSAGLTLPVFSRNASKETALGEKFAALSEKTLRLNEMIAGANADCARAHILERRLSMLGSAIENTNNVRLLKLALEGGEITLLEYLQETSYFIEAAREYNAARLEYALTMASLARWAGQD